MNLRHGSLESKILNALWELEKSGVYKHSVKEITDLINKNQPQKRAYTTIKTVMDRMFAKELLLRVKQGKKFFYRSAYSYTDIIKMSLEKIAHQFCGGDMAKLLRINQLVCEKELLSVKS